MNGMRRFIFFHHRRHPKDMGAASTQNVALNALLFLYRHVLRHEFSEIGEIEQAKRPRRLPTVLTREEVTAMLTQMKGTHRLMANLLYGSGLGLMECLRVKDAYRASLLHLFFTTFKLNRLSIMNPTTTGTWCLAPAWCARNRPGGVSIPTSRSFGP